MSTTQIDFSRMNNDSARFMRNLAEISGRLGIDPSPSNKGASESTLTASDQGDDRMTSGAQERGQAAQPANQSQGQPQFPPEERIRVYTPKVLRQQDKDRQFDKAVGCPLPELPGDPLTGSSASGIGIPSSVLKAVPHLRALVTANKIDPHQERSEECRAALNKSEAIRDAVIDKVRLLHLPEPLSRSVWKAIMEEEYVDFEKLYAEIYGIFDSTDQLLDRRPIFTQPEWIRVFEAWEAGVVTLYKHRAEELQSYRQMVIHVFQMYPSLPSVAIQFDAGFRLRHSRRPFRLDSREEYNALISKHMGKVISKQLDTGQGIKRNPPTSSSVGQKRRDVPCRNWNLGKCEGPCINRRKHGVCCVCGEQHRAEDNGECSHALCGWD